MRTLIPLALSLAALSAQAPQSPPPRAPAVVSVTPIEGRLWSVEIAGPEGVHVSRAQILTTREAREAGFYLAPQAARKIERQARDARISRVATAGRIGVGICPALSTFALTRIRSHSTAASYTSVATILAGAACALWGAADARIQADRPDPSQDVVRLFPDAGITLDQTGGWSGLLVSARRGQSFSVEIQ